MPFTVQVVQSYKVIVADTFGTGGRTEAYRLNTLEVTGASRRHSDVQSISAGGSNVEVPLSPIAASLPGHVLFLQSDRPLDVRLNASNATMISQVLAWIIGVSGAISALFVTNTDSLVSATLMLEVIGGGSIKASVPLP